MKRLLLIVALLSASAFGQFRADAFATIGSGGGAYVSPVARIALEPSYSFTDGWKVAGQGFLIPTGKADTHDGFTAGARVEVVKQVHPVWSVGAGEGYSYTHTSRYEKHAARPYLMAVWRIEDCCDGLLATVSTRFFLPWGDARNGLIGPEFTFDVPLRRHERWTVRGVLGFFSIYPTDAPQLGRQAYITVAGGIGYRLK